MTEAIHRFVYGVDPGTTTGLALVRFTTSYPPTLVRCTELPWNLAADKLWEDVRWISGSPTAVVVCESYMLTSKSAQRGQAGAEDAMEMNGVARMACHVHGVDFAPRQKSASKKSVTDASLKAAGLWQRGKVHANDAIRHAVLYGMRKRWFDLAVLVPR